MVATRIRKSDQLTVRRTYAAVSFSDLCGSTRLAAELDVDTYAEMLGIFRDEAKRIVDQFRGDVAQVYGDGILSIFQGGSGAARAIDAALMLHQVVADMAIPNPTSTTRLRLHSGIHSGLALLRKGDLSRGTIEAVGRTTAIAARLSAAAAPDEILVSAGSLGPSRSMMTIGRLRRIDLRDGTAGIMAVSVLDARLADPHRQTPTAEVRKPFVGRSPELTHLERSLSAFLAGKPFKIALFAPPGQGKTRLAREVRELATRRGLAVFQGSCSASAAVGPLLPFRQIVTDMAIEDIADEGARTGDFDVKTLIALIRDRAVRQPLLLILDNWQWADSASLTTLAKLRELNERLGLLILSREPASCAVPLDGFTELRLSALTPDETEALVYSRRPDFDPLDASRIHLRAGGNPLYVEELCLLEPQAGRSVFRNGAEPAGSGWLASSIAARAQRLTKPVQDVLELAAVIGVGSPRWLLDTLVDPAATDAALPVLVDRDFLKPPENDGGICFKHGITWETVYSLIPLARRRRFHAEIAELLAQREMAPEIDIEEALAWHFIASGQPARGWKYAERAGDRAVKLGSLDRARVQYHTAIDAMTQLPDTELDYPRYTAIVAKFGYVSIFDADATQMPIFADAIRRAVARHDRKSEAEAEYWLGYVGLAAGNSRQAIVHCERALALSEMPDHSPFRVQVGATLGQAYAGSADYARAVPLLDAAIGIKRAHRSGLKASVGIAYTLSQRAAVSGDTGKFAEAHAMFEEALGVLNGEAHPVEASILSWSAAVCAWQGDWDGLLAAAARAATVAQSVEAVYIHAISRAFACYARWQLDRTEAAAEGLVAAVDCMIDRGKFMSLSIALGFLAEVEVARGNPAGARRAMLSACVRGRAGDPMGVAWAARAWAAQLAAASPDRARVYLERARRNAERRQSPHERARCDLHEARLRLGPEGGREALLNRAAAAFAGMGMTNLVAEVAAVRRAG